MEGILDMGYGFVEIGSVTPQPQVGRSMQRRYPSVDISPIDSLEIPNLVYFD